MKFFIVGRTGCRCMELIPELEKAGLRVTSGTDWASVNGADVILTKPEKIRLTAGLFPDDSFYLICLCSDESQRRANAVEDGIRSREYEQIAAAEDRTFAPLERWIADPDMDHIYPENVAAGLMADLDETDRSSVVGLIVDFRKRHEKCVELISRCVEEGSLRSPRPGAVAAAQPDAFGFAGSEEYTVDAFADMVLSSPVGMASLMDLFLGAEKKKNRRRPCVPAGRKKAKSKMDTDGSFEQLSFVFRM